MTGKSDDLEAVRVLAATLEPFSGEDRERIIRWAREKLGMTASVPPSTTPRVESSGDTPRDLVAVGGQAAVDIKKFVTDKAPRSDVHFAATVAYYYQFKAPESQRKDSITREDVVEACRQVDRKRPKRPAQVLVNAYHDGLFDRGGKGSYTLNSVGENLVAMALPGTNDSGKVSKRTPTSGPRKGHGKKKGIRKGR
jgi:hypothetical protein